MHAKLKDYFKTVQSNELISKISLKATLGQGTYGRVRLCEHGEAKTAIFDEGYLHSGFFAVKVLKKSEVIRLKQVEHIKSEKFLLDRIVHPFIMNMYRTYKDERNLYMLTEFVPGGEMLGEVRAQTGCLSNETAKFYAAQLVMALQYLHSDDIIYRGLVPDNLLVDKVGYLKLVDFGFAKKLPTIEGVTEKTYTLCGTAEYLAPEVVSSKGHGKGADWWALGVLIYEMRAGYPPFYADNPFEIYQKILKAQPLYPGHFDINLYEGIVPGNKGSGVPNAPEPGGRDPAVPLNGLICKLLNTQVHRRIGCLKNGAEDIKKHKWFRGLNWAQLYNKQMPCPDDLGEEMLDGDPSKYAHYPDSIEESGPLLQQEKQDLFAFWVKNQD